MKKIIRKPEAKGQKYFIFSVSSFFVLISLAIITYITSFILSSGSNVPEESNSLSNLVYLLEKSIYVIKKIFTASNISVIGFIFSFAIIISAYFFFDSHRQAKEKLNKL
jgi:galactitol-specific phosphotransferase system IIC component